MIRREEVKLSYGSVALTLNLDMGVGIGGDKWPAADLFCTLVTDPRWESFFATLFRGKSVIDLGSGTGLTSIVVHKQFPDVTDICVTDLESHIEHIKTNIDLNKTLLSDGTVNGNIRASAFDWLNIARDDKGLGKFDIILAFECVYKEELYMPFIDALTECCHNSSIIFLGLTRVFAKPLFFEYLKKAGFQYTMVPQESLPLGWGNDTTGRDVGLFVVTRV